MPIITSVYDSNNAVSTGFYHASNGSKVPYEYIGTEKECMHGIECLKGNSTGEGYQGSIIDANEVVHIVNRANTLWCNRPIQANPLFSVWGAKV